MKLKNHIIAIISIFSILLSLCGCNSNNVPINWYDFGAEYSAFSSCKVAENSRFTLEWDKDSASVSIFDKNNGKIYTTIPRNETDPITHPQVLSPIMLNCIDAETLNTNTENAITSCIKKGAFSAEKIDNGIKVTYYFENVAISVPVYYQLREDSLLVEIHPDEIGEDETLVSSISILPFFCSIDNNSEKEQNYLFVPSGSGALVYPKTIGSGITSMISEEMYGVDAQSPNYSDSVTESIRLPVYGSKNVDRGMCAIIEESADTASIVTNIGSSTYRYSSVYASFCIRGSQLSTASYMDGFVSKKTLFCQEKINNTIKIGFYPLNEDNADYNGMASAYRNYLISNKYLSKREDDTLINATIIGGVLENKSFLGVPYTGLSVLTSFDDVNLIISDLSSLNNKNINVNLMGFGDSGLDIEKPAGGVDYSSKFGSIKNINNTDKVSLYFNFDLLRFSKSGSGINKLFGITRNAIGGRNKIGYQNVAFSTASGGHYYYIRRSYIDKLSDKVFKKIKRWDIDGVSFDTLSNKSYSDYYDSKYYGKSDTTKQVTEIFSKYKSENYKVASYSANAYAAVESNIIFDVPTRSSNYQVYDKDIPFYSMVFKGYIPMAISAINLSEDYDIAFLKAVESGLGIGYTLINDYNMELISAKQNMFFSSVYQDLKNRIANDVNRYDSLFQSIANKGILNHDEIGDLHITKFENGITVYTNFGNHDINIGSVTIKAKDFFVKEDA